MVGTFQGDSFIFCVYVSVFLLSVCVRVYTYILPACNIFPLLLLEQ